MHVLVVDDEKEISDNVAAYLNMTGHLVSAVYGGEEGVEMLEKTRFDVLITDLDMPGMNGMDLIRAAKRKYVNVRVIVMTGHKTMDVLAKVMAEGISDIIYKPFRFDELDAMIHGA